MGSLMCTASLVRAVHIIKARQDDESAQDIAEWE